MSKLNGKIALITGGNSGIGFAAAKTFIQEGARVVVVGRRKDAVDAAVTELGEAAFGFTADVANLDDLDRLYAEVGRRFGRLDVLFANAGLLKRAPFGTVTPEHFDFEFGVNVRGLFFTVQKALPLLREGSSVILNGSIAHFKGFPGDHLYSAGKAAVRAFARGWTTDLRDRKIRVNVLSPGPTKTPIATKIGLPPETIAELIPMMVAQIPMGRFGEPEEIAKAALFLASDDSSFITGIDLCVDGGMGQI